MDVTYVVSSPNLTEKQAASARDSLRDLARLLGCVSAKACHELGLQPDMKDPEVAREIMLATLEALVLSKPSGRTKNRLRKPIG